MLLKLKQDAHLDEHKVGKTVDGKYTTFEFNKVNSTQVPDDYGKALKDANQHLFEETNEENFNEEPPVPEKEVFDEEELKKLADEEPEKLLELAYSKGIPKTVKNTETAIKKLLEL
jgi:hypothetical protein